MTLKAPPRPFPATYVLEAVLRRPVVERRDDITEVLGEEVPSGRGPLPPLRTGEEAQARVSVTPGQAAEKPTGDTPNDHGGL